MSGSLIVFEGANEVGKSTLAALLYTDLKTREIPCDLVAFPGNESGTLGRHVNDLHHGAARFGIHHMDPTSLQLLHVAAHVDAIENAISRALSQGKVVILDRFWWSTWVYGSSQSVNEKSLEMMIKLELNHWRTVRPMMVFLITRSEPVTPLYEMTAWQNIAALYRKLAERERAKYRVEVVTNDGPLELTYSEICHFVAADLNFEA